MDKQSQTLYSLLADIRNLVDAYALSQQVILVYTSQGNTYHCASCQVGDHTGEDELLKMIVTNNDIDIQYLLCMWNNYQLDVPSFRFRKRLIEISTGNRNAVILLLGENALHAKKLEQLMP